MIASTTTPSCEPQENVSIREELAGVKWTGNVRPVDQGTEKAVLGAYIAEIRVSISDGREIAATLPTERRRQKPTKPQAKPARPGEKLKVSTRNVEDLTDEALTFLQMLASGKSVGAAADACGIHRAHGVRLWNRFCEAHKVELRELRRLIDVSLDGLRRYVLGLKDGVHAPTLTNCQRGRINNAKLPLIDADEARQPSERVLRMLAMTAIGMKDSEVDSLEGLRPGAVANVRRVVGVSRNRLQRLKDTSADGVHTLLVKLERIPR